jgi:protocatechuate 3,4-dioxygenase, alpha subunit
MAVKTSGQTLGQTPSQTAGPFFAYGLTPKQYGYPFASIATGQMADEMVAGERIRIIGQVLDGEGSAIADALIELWQADAQGHYVQPTAPLGRNTGFCGFGRQGTGTDPENRFIFDTIKPGPVDAEQAPHISVIVFMRGLLTHAYTRLYFSDESQANARDPVLSAVPEERRWTLVAKRQEDGPGAVYRFDIRMQGEAETVFFDV